ncbi:hypothetical protein XELAEV_18043058mg [Xenopus laevis]|uniref:Uncharacterized protein n=1 Tax=Xenopus laevis TaxID=8355 RepID=A0A974BVW2_XENLA|nr:hypothetical protein XELAEV_18043058mg [Xenopus laevis]
MLSLMDLVSVLQFLEEVLMSPCCLFRGLPVLSQKRGPSQTDRLCFTPTPAHPGGSWAGGSNHLRTWKWDSLQQHAPQYNNELNKSYSTDIKHPLPPSRGLVSQQHPQPITGLDVPVTPPLLFEAHNNKLHIALQVLHNPM